MWGVRGVAWQPLHPPSRSPPGSCAPNLLLACPWFAYTRLPSLLFSLSPTLPPFPLPLPLLLVMVLLPPLLAPLAMALALLLLLFPPSLSCAHFPLVCPLSSCMLTLPLACPLVYVHPVLPQAPANTCSMAPALGCARPHSSALVRPCLASLGLVRGRSWSFTPDFGCLRSWAPPSIHLLV